jgi:hypothetical protein
MLQVLRALVLLDESEVAARQEGRPRPTPGHVVAEILVGMHHDGFKHHTNQHDASQDVVQRLKAMRAPVYGWKFSVRVPCAAVSLPPSTCRYCCQFCTFICLVLLVPPAEQ